MGMMKELILERQAQQDIAEDIAVEAKVLNRCEWHEQVYENDRITRLPTCWETANIRTVNFGESFTAGEK
jgi:hypothetical protein